ncbi:MAG TPA: alpha/beta hydrolase [Gemmatimonadaceae bacterium]|nr:alpha/beta hydrolase [Gemmatimonadaceae bacterium]
MARSLSANEIFPARSQDISARIVPLRGGLRVRVVEGGPANGQPLLMLHGWGASAYSFRHAFDRLGRHGLRVIAADLRGFGLSDKPAAAGAYSLANYREDVDQLLDALGLDRAHLVGHSMGGGVALQYALARPERVHMLSLVSPTNLVEIPLLRFPKLAPRFVARLLGGRLVPRVGIELILRWVAYGDAALVTEEAVEEYWAPTQYPGYVYAARASLSEFDWNPVTHAQAGSLAVPTVVILGEHDRLIRDAAEAARSLREASVHELAAGHCVHEAVPERVYEIIARHSSSR